MLQLILKNRNIWTDRCVGLLFQLFNHSNTGGLLIDINCPFITFCRDIWYPSHFNRNFFNMFSLRWKTSWLFPQSNLIWWFIWLKHLRYIWILMMRFHALGEEISYVQIIWCFPRRINCYRAFMISFWKHCNDLILVYRFDVSSVTDSKRLWAC